MIVFRSAVLEINGPIAVRKHAAALFRRKKINTFTSLSYGTLFIIHIFTRKELGIRCSRDFACATAGELSSTITNFFGRLTIWTIVNNYSPKWRWLVVDIYRAAKRRGKYPTLATDTEVNSCFSIY